MFVIIQGLPYPESRNELLQILIKKQWTEDSFEKFCVVLNGSGEGKQLSNILTKKIQVFSKASDAGN